MDSQSTKKELSLHCCRTTRNPEDITDLISELLKVYCGEHGRDLLERPPPKPEDIRNLISELLKEYCGEHGRDLFGTPLLDDIKVKEMWQFQQNYVLCILDPSGSKLYVQTGLLKTDTSRCTKGVNYLVVHPYPPQ